MNTLATPKVRDMEPSVSAVWRAADKLSLAEHDELHPHIMGLIEAREKLDRAIEIAGRKEAA